PLSKLPHPFRAIHRPHEQLAARFAHGIYKPARYQRVMRDQRVALYLSPARQQASIMHNPTHRKLGIRTPQVQDHVGLKWRNEISTNRRASCNHVCDFLFNAGHLNFDVEKGAVAEGTNDFLEARNFGDVTRLLAPPAFPRTLAQSVVNSARDAYALQCGIMPDDEPLVGGRAHVELKTVAAMLECQFESFKGIFASVFAGAAVPEEQRAGNL